MGTAKIFVIPVTAKKLWSHLRAFYGHGSLQLAKFPPGACGLQLLLRKTSDRRY